MTQEGGEVMGKKIEWKIEREKRMRKSERKKNIYNRTRDKSSGEKDSVCREAKNESV